MVAAAPLPYFTVPVGSPHLIDTEHRFLVTDGVDSEWDTRDGKSTWSKGQGVPGQGPQTDRKSHHTHLPNTEILAHLFRQLIKEVIAKGKAMRVFEEVVIRSVDVSALK